MIKSLLIAGFGSFIGGALRYGISALTKQHLGTGFPWATLSVNLLGCLVFGILFALFSKSDNTSGSWCLLLTTGLCGGFTTFSAFANEGFVMLQSGNWSGFLLYAATSVIAGISLVALGYWLVK